MCNVNFGRLLPGKDHLKRSFKDKNLEKDPKVNKRQDYIYVSVESTRFTKNKRILPKKENPSPYSLL